jgi:hypothetical protein
VGAHKGRFIEPSLFLKLPFFQRLGKTADAGYAVSITTSDGLVAPNRAAFSLTRAAKRPHELGMDSSHHARRIRASARRLSAGAWDMRMH